MYSKIDSAFLQRARLSVFAVVLLGTICAKCHNANIRSQTNNSSSNICANMLPKKKHHFNPPYKLFRHLIHPRLRVCEREYVCAGVRKTERYKCVCGGGVGGGGSEKKRVCHRERDLRAAARVARLKQPWARVRDENIAAHPLPSEYAPRMGHVRYEMSHFT